MHTCIFPNLIVRNWPRLLASALCFTLCALASRGVAQTESGSAAGGQIQETGQAAVTKIQTLWQRIDERRLKNRTPDQIVAWVIMGLLVGGLLYRFGKRNLVASVLLGLVGAFIGGILANVLQINLGLGPVLITYEELLFTLLGGFLMLCASRWGTIIKLFKRPAP